MCHYNDYFGAAIDEREWPCRPRWDGDDNLPAGTWHGGDDDLPAGTWHAGKTHLRANACCLS